MSNNRSTSLLIVGFIVAAIAMGAIGFFWLGTSSTAPAAVAGKPAAVAPKSTAPEVSQGPVTTVVTPPTGTDQPPAPPMPAPAEGSPLPANMSAEERARAEADQKIGMILAQNPTVDAARDKLVNLFNQFTPYEKIVAAPHIVNLVGDEQLNSVVGFLKNPNTPLEAKEVFFNDMLNRAPQVGWPVLVEVIATPQHPLAERAKELLTTIVGQDYGNDVFGWQRGLREQLIQQGAIPAEPTPPTTPGAPPATTPAPGTVPQQ